MLNVLGCEINLIDQGTGTPVVFLHGNPDSSQVWTPVAAELASSYRCIVPDLPGFGKSKAPADFDYTLSGQAAFLEALYSALGIQGPVHLVGHDFGGIFGAAWMTSHPDRVRSFTAINTTFCTAYRWHFWAHVWRAPIVGELSMLTMNRPLFGMELRRGSRRLTNAHIDAAYALLTPSVKRTTLSLYRAVRRMSFAGWEERFKQAANNVPTLVLWGEGDPFIPVTMAETFSANRVVKYPGAGHWLPVVEPERVSQELLSFLRGAA